MHHLTNDTTCGTAGSILWTNPLRSKRTQCVLLPLRRVRSSLRPPSLRSTSTTIRPVTRIALLGFTTLLNHRCTSDSAKGTNLQSERNSGTTEVYSTPRWKRRKAVPISLHALQPTDRIRTHSTTTQKRRQIHLCASGSSHVSIEVEVCGEKDAADMTIQRLYEQGQARHHAVRCILARRASTDPYLARGHTTKRSTHRAASATRLTPRLLNEKIPISSSYTHARNVNQPLFLQTSARPVRGCVWGKRNNNALRR